MKHLKKFENNEHKKGLISLYEEQLFKAGPFMSIVLKEAIRKLKESDLPPTKVENWVVNLEKAWRTI